MKHINVGIINFDEPFQDGKIYYEAEVKLPITDRDMQVRLELMFFDQRYLPSMLDSIKTFDLFPREVADWCYEHINHMFVAELTNLPFIDLYFTDLTDATYFKLRWL